MKKSITVILIVLVNIAIFADSHKAQRENKAFEDGSVTMNNRPSVITYGNPVALDTTRKIPGLVTWWDYATNGQNQHQIVVLGDTVMLLYNT